MHILATRCAFVECANIIDSRAGWSHQQLSFIVVIGGTYVRRSLIIPILAYNCCFATALAYPSQILESSPIPNMLVSFAIVFGLLLSLCLSVCASVGRQVEINELQVGFQDDYFCKRSAFRSAQA